MRGIAVLALAFVLALAVPITDTVAAQATEPAPSPTPPGYPGDYEQPATDAVLQGRVLDASGNPVADAMVNAYNYGGPVYYADSAEAEEGGGSSGSDGVASEDPARYPYYGGNQTTSGSDGSYRLGVYSGSNQVSVYRDGYASANLQVDVEPGQTVAQDITLEKFPDKTARIQGRVTDARTGAGLAFASVSVSNPQYGTYECSMREGEGSSGSGEVKPMPAEDASTSIVAPDYYPGCAIAVGSDGRFDGYVTPGYSIVSVYAYSDCVVSSDADGSSSSSCGPQYFSFSRSLQLPANATTTVNAALRSHPAPDAVVSGYLIDAESGEAIPGAQISFSNQESYGYGWATTDSDGSYSIRLRSGFHQVSVYAENHFPWEGVLDVKAGDSDFDVKLTPGQASYGGGCCWLYAREGMAVTSDTAAGAPSPPPSPPASPSAMGADGDDASEESSREEVLYEDLGGGLGPYDASEREQHLAGADGEAPESADGNGIPSPGVLLALAALGAVLLLRRRTA